MVPPTPQDRYFHFLTLEPVNVTLFEKRVFVGITKLKILRSSRITWVGPKPNDKCP